MRIRLFPQYIPRAHRNGVTLIEVVISIGLMSITTVSFMASLVFNLRTMRDTLDRQMALEAMHLWEARLLSANPARLGEWNVTAGTDPYENQFRSAQTLIADPTFPETAPTVVTTFGFKGWGYSTAGSGATSLVRGKSGLTTGNPGENHLLWDVNEWNGNIVVIAAGAGTQQVARIVSNTSTVLTTTTDIRDPSTSGYNSAQAWIVNPNATSYYRIANGRTVRFTATWPNSMRRTETLQRQILINGP